VVASPSTPAPSPAIRADEVALRITADAPIDRVSAPGIHGAEVDGTVAKLVVARWGGDLPIEAVLEGGVKAHAVAESDGPRAISLVDDPVPPPIASTPSSAAPPVPEPRSTARPAGHVAPPAQRPSELHANPYGP
jgi:hypothetical protein